MRLLSTGQKTLHTKYRKAIQLLACSSNIYLRRDYIGVTKDVLKRVLGTSLDNEIQEFLDISNMVLKEETIPSKIFFDDILGRYIYVQGVDAEILKERLSTEHLFLLLLMYYKQSILGERNTPLLDILTIIDPSVTERPAPKAKDLLGALAQYGLITSESDETYRVTRVGENFLTPLFLNRLTIAVTEKNVSMSSVLEFFKQEVINPNGYAEETVINQVSLF